MHEALYALVSGQVYHLVTKRSEEEQNMFSWGLEENSDMNIYQNPQRSWRASLKCFCRCSSSPVSRTPLCFLQMFLFISYKLTCIYTPFLCLFFLIDLNCLLLSSWVILLPSFIFLNSSTLENFIFPWRNNLSVLVIRTGFFWGCNHL